MAENDDIILMSDPHMMCLDDGDGGAAAAAAAAPEAKATSTPDSSGLTAPTADQNWLVNLIRSHPRFRDLGSPYREPSSSEVLLNLCSHFKRLNKTHTSLR